MTIQHISAAIQQTPLCSKVDKTKLISILAVEIARTVSRAGHTMDENDLLFTCEEVAQLILEDYYPLHIGELPMIIRAGVFEKFGSYYGVNDVYAGLPAIIGRNGIEDIIVLDLTNEEKEKIV